LSWTVNTEGETEILSDIEFLLVIDSKASTQLLTELRKNWDVIENGAKDISPFFHIDSAIVTTEQARNQPRWLRTFDARSTGTALSGNVSSEMLPEVTIENLDYTELNEVLLWRLWAILLGIRPSFLFGSVRKTDDEKRAGYLICRNGLDIASWALPHDKQLISGFKSRVAYITEHIDHLPTCREVDPEFPYWLSIYQKAKFQYKFDCSWLTVYARVIREIEAGLAWLCDVKIAQLDERLMEGPSRLFTDSRLRAKLRQLRNAAIRPGQAARYLRWAARRSPYALCTGGLLRLHQAMLGWIDGDTERALGSLAQACTFVRILSGEKTTPQAWPGSKVMTTEEFPAAWIALRSQIGQFLIDYVPSISAKRVYVAQMLMRQ
jgi:hypothetical protein